MGRDVNQGTGTLNRSRAGHAWLQTGLSIAILLLAVAGLFLEEGLQRIAFVTAFGAMGLGNLIWGVSRLLAPERAETAPRLVVQLCFLVMLVALPVAVALKLLN